MRPDPEVVCLKSFSCKSGTVMKGEKFCLKLVTIIKLLTIRPNFYTVLYHFLE